MLSRETCSWSPPDGSRAGIAWTRGEEPRFAHIAPYSLTRWGVYHVVFITPMNTVVDAQRNFQLILVR